MAKSFRAVSPSQSQVFHFRFQIGLRCYIIKMFHIRILLPLLQQAGFFFSHIHQSAINIYVLTGPNVRTVSFYADLETFPHFFTIRVFPLPSSDLVSNQIIPGSMTSLPSHQHLILNTQVMNLNGLLPYSIFCVFPSHLECTSQAFCSVLPLSTLLCWTNIFLGRQSQCSSPKYYPVGYTQYFAFFSINNVLHLIFWLICSSFVTVACHVDLSMKFEGEVPI